MEQIIISCQKLSMNKFNVKIYREEEQPCIIEDEDVFKELPNNSSFIFVDDSTDTNIKPAKPVNLSRKRLSIADGKLIVRQPTVEVFVLQ